MGFACKFSHHPILWPTGWWLSPTPLKNLTSSVGMMTFPIYGKIIQMFQSTNQIWNIPPIWVTNMCKCHMKNHGFLMVSWGCLTKRGKRALRSHPWSPMVKSLNLLAKKPLVHFPAMAAQMDSNGWRGQLVRWFTYWKWQYFNMKHPKRVDVVNVHDYGHVNYWYVNVYSCLFHVPHSRLKTFKRGVARVRELTKDINQFWEVWGQVGYGILVIFLAV